MLTYLTPHPPANNEPLKTKYRPVLRGEQTHRSQNDKLIKSCQNGKILKYYNAVVKTNVDKYVEYLHVELDTTRQQTEMSKCDTTCRMSLDSGRSRSQPMRGLVAVLVF